jgi:hypothetical protein
MKGLGFLLITAFGFSGFALSEEPAIRFELPDALKFDAPEVSGGREHFKKAFDEMGPELRAQGKLLLLAGEKLDKGLPVEDAEWLKRLAVIHRRANDLLKPPLLFPRTIEGSTAVDLFYLNQSAIVLARNALVTGDEKQADQILDDMLRWNRDLQAARPSMFESMMARNGWKFAFNTMLADWAKRDDQTERLTVIAGFHDRYRPLRMELVDVVKSEADWCARFGDVSRLLKDSGQAESITMMLKPPFNELAAAELLKLPYDAKADFQREMDTKLGMIEGLKSGNPINQWKGFEVVATGHRLEDYANRPNGLGDLFHEQSNPMMVNSTLTSTLSLGVLLDACLHWLRIESIKAAPQTADFSQFTDPVDGKPLHIDFERRVIRCRGTNQMIDKPEKGAPLVPSAGFSINGDDLYLVVPKWNSASAPER